MMGGEILVLAAAALICGLIYILRQVSKYLTAKMNALKSDERVNDKLFVEIGLDLAERAVKTVTEAAVGKLEETKAKKLREMVKNGEADISELKALAVEAYGEIVATVKPELLQDLSEGLQDVELYIRNQIESQLGLLKKK